jgi:hypothetical protein
MTDTIDDFRALDAYHRQERRRQHTQAEGRS